MNWTPSFLRRRKLFDDLSEEMRLHIEEHVEQLMREGMSAAEAQRQARIAFGNPVVVEEHSREVWLWPTLESILADVRFALRQLRRSPGFSVTAILTLAMAIGANATVFSVMSGLILRPLKVPQPDSLYSLQRTKEKDTNFSYPDYLDLHDRNRSFQDLAAFTIPQVTLNTGENPIPTWGVEATGNYFDSLRIQPYLGRFFHASDEHGPNSAPYVVLSYAYWHSHFHDDRAVLGRTIEVNKHPFKIIGVAPDDFRGTLVFFSPSFFVPIVNCEQVDGYNYLRDRGNRSLISLLGHLKEGNTPAEATADLKSIGSYLEKSYPKDEGSVAYSLTRPSLLGDQFAGPFRAFMGGLMVLVALILMAACANLGGLFAARTADRSREVALRLALGSTRKRILRGLFTEAVLISLVGGSVGLGGSVALLRWLSEWQPFGNFPVHAPVNPDATVCGLALLLSFVSGFLFGVVPLGQILRTNPYELVKAGSTGAPRSRITARDALLTLQIAICAVLVTSSLVAARGLVRSLHGHFGFVPQNAMLITADLHMAGYTGDRIAPMQKRMLNAVAGIPGIESVGFSDPLLLNDTSASDVYRDQTTDLRAQNAAASVYQYRISPEYLQAEGTTLLSGRHFTWQDDKNAPRVAVVNREFARKIFGSVEDALGGHFRMPDGTRIRVAGIVEDGKYASLTEDAHPAIFLPILQWPAGTAWLVVRSGRDPRQLGPVIRSTLRQLDAGLPVVLETRYDEMVGVLFPAQMATLTLGIMGGIGAMLAVIGIFGMASFSVSKRLKELGIRVALGAQRQEILRAALGRACKLLAIGSIAGLGLGILATRLLAFIVYQETPRDPLVLAGVAFAMALLGLVATWIPAQRALSVNPIILLRED